MYDAFYTYYSKKRYGHYLPQLNSKVDCFHYTVSLGGHEVSSLYSSEEFTVIVLPDRVFRIDRITENFLKREYRIYDNQTQVLIGNFDIPRYSWGDKAECLFELFDDAGYRFSGNRAPHRTFESLSVHERIYELVDCGNRSWVYRGNQACGDIAFFGPDRNDLLLSCGIFMIDEKFRLERERQDS